MSRVAAEPAPAPRGAGGAVPLDDVLGRAVEALWPARAKQELLFDLGERKRWTSPDATQAVVRLAAWLQAELGLPEVLAPTAASGLAVSEARRLAAVLCGPPPRSVGVAKDLVALQPLVGSSSPKALANSLSEDLRSRRGDHRWLLALATVAAAPDAASRRLDAWLFHERSRVAVVAELSGLAGRLDAGMLDAGDAVLVFSLLALWQRRRPAEEARGNRGKASSRRAAPKPVAALDEELIGLAQLDAILAAARRVSDAAGRCLTLLAIEAALTQAHLVPHTARRAPAGGRPSDRWLPRVRAALSNAWLVDLVGVEAAALLGHRVARMRAYRDGEAPPPAPALVHPHLTATSLIDSRQTSAHSTSLSLDDRGVLMLAPQLRARGLLQEEPR